MPDAELLGRARRRRRGSAGRWGGASPPPNTMPTEYYVATRPCRAEPGWYTTLSSPAAGAGWGGRQERAARHPGYPSLVPFPAVGAPRPSRSRATPVGRVLGSPVCASGAEPPPAAGRQLIDERRPPRCRLRAGRHRAARAYACRVANGWCGSSDANAYSV